MSEKKRKQKGADPYPHALGEVMLHVEIRVHDAAGQLLDMHERTYQHSKREAKSQFDAIKAALEHNAVPRVPKVGNG